MEFRKPRNPPRCAFRRPSTSGSVSSHDQSAYPCPVATTLLPPPVRSGPVAPRRARHRLADAPRAGARAGAVAGAARWRQLLAHGTARSTGIHAADGDADGNAAATAASREGACTQAPSQARRRRSPFPRRRRWKHRADVAEATETPSTPTPPTRQPRSDVAEAANEPQVIPGAVVVAPVLPPRVDLAYNVYYGTRGFLIGEADLPLRTRGQPVPDRHRGQGAWPGRAHPARTGQGAKPRPHHRQRIADARIRRRARRTGPARVRGLRLGERAS